MTVAMQVAACVAALSSLSPTTVPQPRQLVFSLALVGFLMFLNLRGVKESVQVLFPIFLLFLVTHAFVIAYGIGAHTSAVSHPRPRDGARHQDDVGAGGGLATIALLLKAFSMGGGTYTGLEAVSNGLQALRDPA